MINSLLKLIGAFLAPLVTILLPLQQALIVLLIFVLINYVSQSVISFKEARRTKNILIRSIMSIFSQKALTTLFKRLYEYSFALTMVGLFEVYILNIPVNLGNNVFSLLHFTIIVASCLEITRGFKLNEEITGNNMLETIKNFIPDRFINLFKKDSN